MPFFHLFVFTMCMIGNVFLFEIIWWPESSIFFHWDNHKLSWQYHLLPQTHVINREKKPVWIKMEKMSRLRCCIIHTSVIKRFASENCRRTERIVTSIQWRNVSTSVRQTKCSFDTIEHIQLRCETTTAQPICYRGSRSSLSLALARSFAHSLAHSVFNSNTRSHFKFTKTNETKEKEQVEKEKMITNVIWAVSLKAV